MWASMVSAVGSMLMRRQLCCHVARSVICSTAGLFIVWSRLEGNNASTVEDGKPSETYTLCHDTFDASTSASWAKAWEAANLAGHAGVKLVGWRVRSSSPYGIFARRGVGGIHLCKGSLRPVMRLPSLESG